MSRLHLISSDVNGVTTYYTAYADGTIASIGTDLNFDKGFGDDILANISNTVYSSLTNGKVWTNDTDITTEASEVTNGSGIVMTRKETAINTIGYSGISSITATVTGSPLFGISFTGNGGFMTRGTVNYTSSTKYIPSDSTSRASLVTISSKYDNLFDNNQDTYASASVSGELVTMTFATAVVLKKFVGRLASVSAMPTTITLQVLDPATSTYVDIGSTASETSKNDFEVDCTNTISAKEYRFRLDYTAGTDGKVASLSEFNVYAQASKIGWVYTSKEDVATKGMTLDVLKALTVTDYAELFNNTQLDIYTYIPAGATVTDITVSFPANTAPTVINFNASALSTHANEVLLNFDVKDLEGQSTFYKISINGSTGVYLPTNSNGQVRNEIITNDMLIIGSNKITITVKDELGAEQAYDYTINKIDSLPTFVGTRVDNNYSFTIKDTDADKIKYTISLNGEVLVPTTDYYDVTYNNSITWDKTKVKVGSENVLTVTITDAVGGITTVEEKWIGTYTGLLFSDASNAYLTSDLGVLLKYLDFGILVAGKPSLPLLLNVTNTTSYLLKSVSLQGPGYLDASNANSVEFCLQDSFVTDYGHNISLNDMVPNQVIQVYVRINSTNAEAVGDYEFTTTSTGINS